jgi:hypothetical protein
MHIPQILPRLPALAAVAVSVILVAGNAQAACTLTVTNSAGTSSSTGANELSAFGTSYAGFLPSSPLPLTITASADCPSWTAVSADPTFVTLAFLEGGRGASTLWFNAFANTHPSERTTTITVTAGSTSVVYPITELGSADPLANREVRALYQRILSREPDSGGFTFWVGVANANPGGLGMMVDNFLTAPEAMDRDFMVLAIYQSLLGTPTGALSPVTYADWSTAINQFLIYPDECGGFCGWQLAGNALINALIPSSTVSNEMNSVVIPSCQGITASPAATLTTLIYQNTLGVPPTCAQLSDGLGVVNSSYSSATGETAFTGVINLLYNIWCTPVVPPPVAPTSLSFSYQSGAANSLIPAPLTINVPGAWTAFSSPSSWIVVSPTSGTGPGTVTVTVYPGLPEGTLTGAIYFNTSAGPQTVTITLLISKGAPVIYTDTPVLTAANCCLAIRTVQVLTSDGSQVPYTITTSTPGIYISSTTGVTPGSFMIGANSNYLDRGTFYGSVYITSPAMANSPLTVPVELGVSASNQVFTNPIFLKTTNPLFVDLLYFTTLGRDPDPGGFAFWLNIANSGGLGVYSLPSAGGNPPAIRTAMEGTGVPNQGFVGSPEFLGLFK